MQDIRPAELECMIQVSSMLTEKFPKLFGQGTYEHPLLGARTTLTFKTRNNESVDVANISDIHIDFKQNFLRIRCSAPEKVYNYFNFMEDETVM